jgi:hypothetical protein
LAERFSTSSGKENEGDFVVEDGNGDMEVLYYRPQRVKIERMSIGGLE